MVCKKGDDEERTIWDGLEEIKMEGLSQWEGENPRHFQAVTSQCRPHLVPSVRASVTESPVDKKYQSQSFLFSVML